MLNNKIKIIILVLILIMNFLNTLYALERINEEDNNFDLIDVYNFGSLNLETFENSILDNEITSNKLNDLNVKSINNISNQDINEINKVENINNNFVHTTSNITSNEIDVISKILPDETYEVIGSSAATNPEAEKHFKIGTELFNQKQYVKAKAHFEKAVKLEGTNDVYLLALDMVISTMRSYGIKDEKVDLEDEKNTLEDKSKVSNNKLQTQTANNNIDTNNSSVSIAKSNIKEDKNLKNKNITKKALKTQVFTCNFDNYLPVGNIIFNLGINTTVKKSDLDGYYVYFNNEKESMALAAFRLDYTPKKAILIITQKLFTDDNNIIFPLVIKVNNFEALNGAYKISKNFQPYQFDVTNILHRGYNQILFQCAPFNFANYALSRIDILIQNY